jgi:hypothetical protein
VNDFSIFGPWGIVGMPGMADRVTTMDMRGWSGGGLGLDDLYMKVDFGDDVPGDDAHRYALRVDNRVAFDPQEYLQSGEPPVWADIPFLSATPVHGGIGQLGNFLFDTGAQISLISEHLAIAIGLDSNGDGLLNAADEAYLGSETVGGVGGQSTVPVFSIDELRVPVTNVSTGVEVDLVWTDLQWLVLDIEVGAGQPPLDGVFGCDLLTSGWFYAFFYPGMPDGYFDQVHLDFRGWTLSTGAPAARTGTVYLDLNPAVDEITEPGPGVRIQESARATEVVKGATTDTYTIALATLPAAPVTVTVTTDGLTQISGDEGTTYSTSLEVVLEGTFPQLITVSAPEDGLETGPQTSVITHTVVSADPAYDGIAVRDVLVQVLDYDRLLHMTSDAAGEDVITSLDVAEGGADEYYYICLLEPPASEVWVLIEDPAGQAVPWNPNNTIEGFENVWQFSVGNWDQPQPVRLTAVDDEDAEGPHATQLAHTVLDLSSPLDPIVGQDFLTVDIADNDQSSVTVTRTGGATEVGEGGPIDEYQIAVDEVPDGPVEVTVTADAQLEVSADGGVSFAAVAVLTFPDTAPRTITVRAVDDDVDEATHTGKITHRVTGDIHDPRFPRDLVIDGVIVTIVDNDAAGLAVADDPAGEHLVDGVDVVEGGAGSVYWMVLTSQPKHEVTIVMDVEGTPVQAVDDAHPSNAYLRFTSDTWAVPQALRVTVPDNGVRDELRTVHVTLELRSADPSYQGAVVVPVHIADATADITLSLSASAVVVTRPDALTLTATPSNGTHDDLRQVRFYRDSDRDGAWREGVDQLWGIDNSGVDGWSLPIQTYALPPAQHTFFARAEDAAGRWTAPASVAFETLSGGLIDLDAPSAVLDVSPIETAGGASHRFAVTLSDAVAVDVATLGDGDLWVRGPAGYQQPAVLISVDEPANGTPRTAVYEIPAPGAQWVAEDSGIYEIWMLPLAVGDVDGHYVRTGRLGTFAVTIDPTRVGQVPPEPAVVVSDDRFVMRDGQLQLRPGQSLSNTGEPTLTLELEVPDTTPATPPNDLHWSVTVWTQPWRHPTEPRDVNRDGAIGFRDALLIINRLNAGAAGVLPLVPAETEAFGFLLDVNGDHHLSAHDALLVINWINSQTSSGGEGESTSPAEPRGWVRSPSATVSGVVDHRADAVGVCDTLAAAGESASIRHAGLDAVLSSSSGWWRATGHRVSPGRSGSTVQANGEAELRELADWIERLADDIATASHGKGRLFKT